MIDYIMNNDLNNAAIYNEIQQRMNVDSFIDHIIMTIYCANTSWGTIVNGGDLARKMENGSGLLLI